MNYLQKIKQAAFKDELQKIAGTMPDMVGEVGGHTVVPSPGVGRTSPARMAANRALIQSRTAPVPKTSASQQKSSQPTLLEAGSSTGEKRS